MCLQYTVIFHHKLCGLCVAFGSNIGYKTYINFAHGFYFELEPWEVGQLLGGN